MIKRLKSKTNLIYLAIAAIVLLMLIFGKSSREDIETLEKELGLKDTGSGFLEVDTFPGDADIYVDGILKGKSPDTLYNIPAGMHNIAIKKEGYADYSIDVNVEAGKKAFIEADLVAQAVKEPEVQEVEEIIEEPEVPEVKEIIQETGPTGVIKDEKEEVVQEQAEFEEKNNINIGTKLQFYYDFSEGKFTDSSSIGSDVFSRRFDTYLVFTRFSPVNIKTINKNIESVNKEDCIGVKGAFEYLYSGRSLCIITKEGKIAAIGGYWENTENANLSWKVFD